MVLVRIPFQTMARAGTMTLLEAFKADSGLPLQLYPGRPRSIAPPTAFIDSITETLTNFTVTTRQRTVNVEVVVLHGSIPQSGFDSLETVTQRDDFVDGFLDWVADNYHGFGANTTVAAVTVDDIPVYIPDWQPGDVQRSYYGTRITLEGFAST